MKDLKSEIYLKGLDVIRHLPEIGKSKSGAQALKLILSSKAFKEFCELNKLVSEYDYLPVGFDNEQWAEYMKLYKLRLESSHKNTTTRTLVAFSAFINGCKGGKQANPLNQCNAMLQLTNVTYGCIKDYLKEKSKVDNQLAKIYKDYIYTE